MRPESAIQQRSRSRRVRWGVLAAASLLGAAWLGTTVALAADSPAGRAVERAKAARSASQERAEKMNKAAATGDTRPLVGSKAAPKPAQAGAKPATPKPAAVKPATGTQSLTQIDEQITYQYNALGRRDPFMSLVGDEYVGADVGGDAPPDLGAIKVVGIVWGTADKFALVEDPRGNSMVLRQGDKVMNGEVEMLTRDAIIIKHTVDGQSERVTVPLTKKGDSNAKR